MTIKTILVHLDTEAQALALTQAAIGLAKTFSAHVIGLHVLPNPFISAAVPADVVGELIEAQRQANEAAAKSIGETFQTAMAPSGVSFEWAKDEALSETTASLVIRHGNTADLVVVGQPDRTINLIDGIATSEESMLGLGRPVLFVPNKPGVPSTGKRVLLAWNGSREAARAAFDALPFLKKAEDVQIFTAGSPGSGFWGSLRDEAAPTAGIAAALSRHGVKATLFNAKAAPSEVGTALLAEAKERSCDLIVMGGYGHWRVREIVFGGATRAILEQTTIPVLMSH